MTTHVLLSWPEEFGQILGMKQNFTLRKTERVFREGDVLVFREWDFDDEPHDADEETIEDHATGRECRRRVTFVQYGAVSGLQRGYIIIGFL